MCSPRMMDRAGASLSRRKFFGLAGAAAIAGIVAPAGCARTQSAATQPAGATQTAAVGALGGPFEVRDLTHTHGPNFPVYPGQDPLEIEVNTTVEEDGLNSYALRYGEHIGTHIDAPFHASNGGLTTDQLPAEDFFAPLAVVDISRRAASDEDAGVTVDDIRAWERRHGRLPEGAFVAMYSGWEERLSDPDSFLNADASGTLHFPAFTPEAGEFLVRRRSIVGLGVDTISLDRGVSTEIEVHRTALPAGKYGLENIANLGEVDASGATIIVGGPKHEGGSGGPTRVFAVSPVRRD